jgi:hypothetical protein
LGHEGEEALEDVVVVVYADDDGIVRAEEGGRKGDGKGGGDEGDCLIGQMSERRQHGQKNKEEEGDGCTSAWS